ncbi:MAG TPA: NUDIX hydrolase [Nocardioidaceae bacterium]|nr:NUDIX hydrolase [Nocardioidaceae bacterium]
MASYTRITGIFLVDRRGWLLLQERDEHAPVAPNQWGIVGGHVDEGEDWEASRDRELLEETGLVLPEGTLDLWYDGVVAHDELRTSHEWRVYVGRVDLADADITCGEGRQIVFVDPAEFGDLDLAESLGYFLPRLVESGWLRTGTSPSRWRDPAS